MEDIVYGSDAWRKWSCEVVRVWPWTNPDTIVGMFIWFCYLKWMIYGGKLIWCNPLTSKMYQVQGTVLVSVRIFVDKINTYYLKDNNTDHVQSCHCFSNIACVKYSIVTSHLHLHLLLLLVKSVQTSHQTTRAQREKTIWRLEIILRSTLIKKRARNIPQ